MASPYNPPITTSQRRDILNNRKTILTLAAALLVGTAFIPVDADARERNRSGSFEGRNTAGTFERSTARENGTRTRNTTAQTERGTYTRSETRHQRPHRHQN